MEALKKLRQALMDAIGIILIRWAIRHMSDELVYKIGRDIGQAMAD